LESNSAGSWDIYFDTSDIGISDDIDGLEIGSNSDIYLQ
jgi:hypothetical protein